MKRKKAMKMAIEILLECERSERCQICAFGTSEGRCLISGGDDTPIDWLFVDRLEKLREC